MMLEYLGFKEASEVIEAAVREAIAEGQTTRDLGGTLSTREAGDAISSRLR
jgi:isocitrate/isopropylmalate dehydrogenase